MVAVGLPVRREEDVIEVRSDPDADGESEGLPVKVCELVAAAVAAVDTVSDTSAVEETVSDCVESVDTEAETEGDADVD
jgi:hypothetical protein